MRPRPAVGTLALALLLQGCGAPGPLVLTDARWDSPSGDGHAVYVDVPAAGRLGVYVDWPSAADDVDVYVTAPDCASLSALVLGECQVLGRDDQVNVKPVAASIQVAPGRYQVWILNIGPADESGVLKVTLLQERR